MGHCSNKISDARVGQDELRCPAGGAGGGCTTPITRHEMKAHLPAELMAKVREDATMENENQSCIMLVLQYEYVVWVEGGEDR